MFKVVLELTKKAATEAAPALVLSICILAVGAVVPIPTLPALSMRILSKYEPPLLSTIFKPPLEPPPLLKAIIDSPKPEDLFQPRAIPCAAVDGVSPATFDVK